MALSIGIRSASNIFHNHNVEDRFNRVHQRDFGISRPLIVWQVLVGHLNLPRIKILFGLRQAGDVVAGIAQSQDRIIEGTSPRGNGLQLCDQLSAFRNVLNVQFTFSSAGPGCRDLWTDCSAFLSCSRSSFNSEI